MRKRKKSKFGLVCAYDVFSFTLHTLLLGSRRLIYSKKP